MPPAAKRRSRARQRPAQDSLRPGWMLNSILFCVLLSAIGGCYVWLGARKKDQAEQILAMHEDIRYLDKQITEMNLQISLKLAPEELRRRTMKKGLDLVPMDLGPKGKVFKLQEPALPDSATDLPPPAPSGNRQP